MEIEEMIKLAENWIQHGRYTYNGLTYRREINEHSGNSKLSEVVVLRITDLAGAFEALMCAPYTTGGVPAKGFTIGRGKALYWYITPQPCGTYRCCRYFDNGEIGSPRYIEPTQLVTVRY